MWRSSPGLLLRQHVRGWRVLQWRHLLCLGRDDPEHGDRLRCRDGDGVRRRRSALLRGQLLQRGRGLLRGRSVRGEQHSVRRRPRHLLGRKLLDGRARVRWSGTGLLQWRRQRRGRLLYGLRAHVQRQQQVRRLRGSGGGVLRRHLLQQRRMLQPGHAPLHRREHRVSGIARDLLERFVRRLRRLRAALLRRRRRVHRAVHALLGNERLHGMRRGRATVLSVPGGRLVLRERLRVQRQRRSAVMRRVRWFGSGVLRRQHLQDRSV